MIKIIDKISCCGCSACQNACPQSCIDMNEDNEGFLYPTVNIQKCIDCHLCEKVCPILNTKENRTPLKVLAVKNKNKNIVGKSSSGGVFFHLAQQVINDGGVVFGACFNKEWEVIHSYTESIEGVSRFMTSKYVQSRVGESYKKVKAFLISGRKVLFTGTPCQVAGLYEYLRKPYSNLITMDFLCHGVPSPKVWRLYLQEEKNKFLSAYKANGRPTISHTQESMWLLKNINFRDKSDGWQNSRFALHFVKQMGKGEEKSVLSSSNHNDNIYMRGFLNDLYLRPSCYKCKFKRFQSTSDITIADYWAIQRVSPGFFDPMGVSMVFVNSDKIFPYISKSVFDMIETSFKDTLSNKGLSEKVIPHSKREYFFNHLSLYSDEISVLINKCVKQSKWKVFLSKIINKIL